MTATKKIHYRYRVLFLIVTFILCSCHHPRRVNPSFYYWKTVYKNNPTEAAYLAHLHVKKLYVRIMDVGFDEMGETVPISPVTFANKLPGDIQIVPVVFIVNDILKQADGRSLRALADHIVNFVNAKVQQSGKNGYHELQIDCDWTASTRENYFQLLDFIKRSSAAKFDTLSATLRLYQLKNQTNCGIPPVAKAMLMCYNMGNLRKYGGQNSILDINELKKYLGNNISQYPMPVDVALPLFKWAVAFRNRQYIGISKSIKFAQLNDKNQFIFIGNLLYRAKTDLPEYGLLKGDEVRWEEVPVADLQNTAGCIATLLKTNNLNLIFFHLDQETIAPYTYEDLEKIIHLLR
jgi:hypothetical protein